MNLILIKPLALTTKLKEILGTEGHINTFGNAVTKSRLWETTGILPNFFTNRNKENKR